MNKFYVYVILNTDKPGEYIYHDIKFEYMPIYIGKGKNNRKNEHFKQYSLKRESQKNDLLKEFNCISIIIVDNLCENKAFEIERHFIDIIGRKDLNKGTLLNLTSGGQGVCGYKYSQKQCLLRSEKQSTTNNGFYNKKHTKDTFDFYKRAVYQIDKDTNEILNKYDSLKEAAFETNSHETHIRECCNKIRKTHNGFKWMDVDDKYFKKRISKNNKTYPKKILKLDRDNSIVLEEFENITECSRITNIRKSTIIECLQGKKKTAGGFKWIYSEF